LEGFIKMGTEKEIWVEKKMKLFSNFIFSNQKSIFL